MSQSEHYCEAINAECGQITELRQQLATAQKREVMLRDALHHLWNVRDPDSEDQAAEALTETSDLADRILCWREPVGRGWLDKNGKLVTSAFDGPVSLYTEAK